MASRRSSTAWIVAIAAVVVVVSAAVVVIVLSLGDDEPTTSVPSSTTPPSGPTSTVPPPTGDGSTTTTEPADVEETDETITVGARERSYLVIRPENVRRSDSLPLVLVLHGLGVDANAMSHAADWRHAVEQERFVAVFPQGEANSWNMGPCCPPANLLEVDDRGFLDALVDQLRERQDVDPERMYLTGFSNGGIMAYAYACHRPGVFAALAPMAGTNLTGCFPSKPIPLLHQHSDPDNVVPYDGGFTVGRLLSAVPFPDVPTSIRKWAQEAGCDDEPRSSTDADDVETFTWAGCPPGASVRLVRIPGTGHAWPDKGGYDPLRELLDFFDIS